MKHSDLIRSAALALTPLTLGAQGASPALDQINNIQQILKRDIHTSSSHEKQDRLFNNAIDENFKISPQTRAFFAPNLSKEERTALLEKALPADASKRKTALATILFQAFIATDSSTNDDIVQLLIEKGAPNIPLRDLQVKYRALLFEALDVSDVRGFGEHFEMALQDPAIPLKDKDALLTLLLATVSSEADRRDILTGHLTFLFADFSNDIGSNQNMLKLYLVRGAATTLEGNQTLAHKVAEYGQLWMLDTLHSLGLPIDKPDNNGQTPLSSALQNGNAKTAGHLLDLNVNAKGTVSRTNHDTYLLYALKNNMLATAQKLIEKGAAIDARIDGEPLAVNLMKSAPSEKLSLLNATKFLLDHGVPADTRSSSGKTLAELIDANNNFSGDAKDAIGYLFYRGGNGDLQGSSLESAQIGTELRTGILSDFDRHPEKYLETAISYQDPGTLQLLLSQPNIKNILGNSRIYRNVMDDATKYYPPALESILQINDTALKGDNPNLPNGYLANPASYNRVSPENMVASLKIFSAMGGQFDPEPWKALVNDLISPLRNNENLKAFLGIDNSQPATTADNPPVPPNPVYVAVRNGTLADLKALDAKGASLNDNYLLDPSLNTKGNLLHVAAKFNKPEIINYLLNNKGFSALDMNSAGELALIDAICGSAKDAVLTLAKVTRGPELNLPSGIFKRTALHWAVLSGDKDMVQAVLDTGIETRARDVNDKSAYELAMSQLTDTQDSNYANIARMIDKKMKEQDAARSGPVR